MTLVKISHFNWIFIFLFISTITCDFIPIFNITENQIAAHLFNIYDIFQNSESKINQTINLKDVELICDRRSSNSDYNLDINRRTGDIIVKTTFDREEICPTKLTDDCTLNYVLSYKSKVKEFNLIIKDVNDNEPQFKEKVKEINIREGDNDKMEYLLPTAVDLDTATFGVEKYSLKMYDDDKTTELFNEYLKLSNVRNGDNSITPVLKIIKLLDREKVEKFSFSLIAWDKNQKFGDCKINVNILDVNDNTPVWITERYSVEIKECSQSKEVIKLEAHDQDDINTENGRITYEIGEKTKTNNKISNLFHISGNILYIDLLKLQEIDIFDFDVEVIAKDGGGKYSTKSVYIKILDCNKNKPHIEINHRNPKINENEKKSIKLSNIIVSDPDRGLNGEFDCVIDDSYRFLLKSMLTKTQKFGKWTFYTLSTVEGVEFDREKVSAIAILITCTDKGMPSQLNTQVITVHISDINDNKPEFTRPTYTFSVEENSQVGIIIGTVLAIDSDNNENGRVSYEIESGMKEIFSVNNKGQVQTNSELDREKINSYEFKVTGKDNGKVSLNSSCTVKVFVLDVNDCHPEVDKQFLFEIVEGRGFSQIHVNLGKIEAKDADLGLNGTLNFKISSLNGKEFGKNLLQITSDGYLTIYGNVDREIMKTIHFEIIVSDNGKPSLSTITTVIINILDVNDNKPKFIFPNYSNNNFINVSIHSSIGSVVAVIEATDPDNGNNGSVFYKLMGGEHIKSFFDLQQSGQLILIKSLMDKRLNPDRLLIQASDGGDPAMSEITTLYLRYFTNNRVHPTKQVFDKKSDNVIKIDKDQLKEPVNVTVLYGLAALLFIVFFAALIILFFVYIKGRTNLTHGFSNDKSNRHRKSYPQNFPTLSNENKGNDELLDPSLCEIACDPNDNAKDNYTHLMFIKDPNYNLLYPRMLSKSEMDTHNDNTLNYFHYQNQPDVSMNTNTMRMLVNNLSPQTYKAQTLLQSNPLLTYKDSIESLNESNYNSAFPTNREKTLATKEPSNVTVPDNSSGYTPSYVTSTFV